MENHGNCFHGQINAPFKDYYRIMTFLPTERSIYISCAACYGRYMDETLMHRFRFEEYIHSTCSWLAHASRARFNNHFIT